MWRRALMTAGVVAIGALAVVPGASGYRGFVAGALAASAFWLVVVRPLPRTLGAGAGAEALSRDLLDAVPQWRAVHELPLDGRTVDHVVVTPLAVLAIDSTWWGPAGDDVRAHRRKQAVERARRNARSVQDLLAGHGLGALPVWPVVLTWGPGAEDTAVGLVDVVSGTDAGAWTTAHSSGAIPDAVAEQVHAALLDNQARHDAPRARTEAVRAAA
jgi:hypothetical protein